jgi:hypothetical protein
VCREMASRKGRLPMATIRRVNAFAPGLGIHRIYGVHTNHALDRVITVTS